MKITKARVKAFERDQEGHSTETAIFNLLFEIAAELLHATDSITTQPVKGIKITRTKKVKK